MVEGSFSENHSSMNVRDLEERQRTLKDRLIIIGQNLIDFKEETESDILKIKKDVEVLKSAVNKIKDFIETLSGEMNKFAKKEDLEILSKQAKIFQTTEFLKKSDLEKLKSKKNINRK